MYVFPVQLKVEKLEGYLPQEQYRVNFAKYENAYFSVTHQILYLGIVLSYLCKSMASSHPTLDKQVYVPGKNGEYVYIEPQGDISHVGAVLIGRGRC